MIWSHKLKYARNTQGLRARHNKVRLEMDIFFQLDPGTPYMASGGVCAVSMMSYLIVAPTSMGPMGLASLLLVGLEASVGPLGPDGVASSMKDPDHTIAAKMKRNRIYSLYVYLSRTSVCESVNTNECNKTV